MFAPLNQLTPPPLIVMGFVLCFLVLFILLYVIPSLRVSSALKRARRGIESLRAGDSLAEKHRVAELVSHARSLQHAWSEYAETLHEQHERREGELRLAQLRATVPAEAFFNTRVLVDNPLRTEFFKHLPGILTGIGIIGTFYGLIVGLAAFDVNTDAEQLRRNLADLLHGVWEAFIASGSAIAVAILITLIEKWRLNRCYRHTEALVQAIDTLYESGAGEEYLSRLVDSAEESAVQTRQLKDALVTDLKELLTNFSDSIARSIDDSLARHTERQIAAQSGMHESMSTTLADAIARSLKEPMAEIGAVTRTLGGNQGEALNDLLSAMIGKLEGSFGGQMQGLNDLMGRNAAAMQAMQDQFGQLIERLASAGETTSAAVEEHLKKLMLDAEQRQQQMNSTMLGLLDQIRAAVGDSQRQSADKLTESLAAISTTVETLLREMAEQRQSMSAAGRQSLGELQTGLAALIEEVRRSSSETGKLYGEELQRLFAAAEHRQQGLNNQVQTLIDGMQRDQETRQARTSQELQDALSAILDQVNTVNENHARREQERDQADMQRAERFNREAADLLDRLATQMGSLGNAVAQGSAALQQAVARLEQVTVQGAANLQQGAGAVREAASGMSQAGSQVAQVLERTAGVQGQVAQTAQGLSEAARTVNTALAGYQQQRTQIETLLGTLRSLIEDADTRAGLSRELVTDMQHLVGKVRELQGEASQYLEQVNDVLGQGFDGFAEAVTTNMSKARAEFDRTLADAVGMIAGQIQELEAALDQLVRAAGAKGR